MKYNQGMSITPRFYAPDEYIIPRKQQMNIDGSYGEEVDGVAVPRWLYTFMGAPRLRYEVSDGFGGWREWTPNSLHDAVVVYMASLRAPFKFSVTVSNEYINPITYDGITPAIIDASHPGYLPPFDPDGGWAWGVKRMADVFGVVITPDMAQELVDKYEVD